MPAIFYSRRFSLTLLTAIAFCSSAYASEPTLTARDAQQQKTVIAALDMAAKAAQRGDHTTANSELRKAVFAGGYSLPGGLSGMACGRSAFELPPWLLTAQALLGDDTGARESARYGGNAWWSAELLHKIALQQNGKAPLRPGEFILSEAVPQKAGAYPEFTYRPHNYEILKRLIAAPRPEAARVTLRLALPYAEAATIAEESQRKHQRPYLNVLQISRYMSQLSLWQAEAGDAEGARQTISRIRRSDEQAFAWQQLAVYEKQHKIATASETAKQAEHSLTTLTDPEDRATVLFRTGNEAVGHKDYVAARRCFTQALPAIEQIPDLHQRFDALNLLFVAAEMEDTSSITMTSHQNEADKALRRKILFLQRDIVMQMPPDPPPTYDPMSPTAGMAMMNNPPRAMLLTNIASDFAIEMKDKTEARKTVEMAKDLADKITDTRLRNRCQQIVATIGDHLENQRQPSTRP